VREVILDDVRLRAARFAVGRRLDFSWAMAQEIAMKQEIA
jgi:hypothetical protein